MTNSTEKLDLPSKPGESRERGREDTAGGRLDTSAKQIAYLALNCPHDSPHELQLSIWSDGLLSLSCVDCDAGVALWEQHKWP